MIYDGSFVRELGVGPAEYRVLHRRPAAARAAACKRPTKRSYPKG
jgi:hypothetical protein